MILDGRLVAQVIKTDLKNKVNAFYLKNGYKPCLATILVGDDPASLVYVKMKQKACLECGIDYIDKHLDSKTTNTDLLQLIATLNQDPKVSGILLQHPVPDQIDELAAFNAININKDVDGVNPDSFGRMAMGLTSFLAATPDAILAILDYYHIDVKGLKVVVVGRSAILGKPIAMALLNRDATVTICHSQTKNLCAIINEADLIIAATNQPHLIKSQALKKDVIIIDAGYSQEGGNVDLTNNQAKYFTPVPGGVGPVTIAKLLEHTYQAASNEINERTNK